MAKAIPDGYHTVTPYLSVRDAAAALDFYKRAFGAMEIMRMPGPDGKIGHAEIRIGDSRVMLADEYAAMEFLSPKSRGGTTVHIHLYVEDADTAVAEAVAAGAELKRSVQQQFY
ncbi:MAG: VOC family protein, partial [Methyloceanibacter sp.]|nr:VOC family protein [Methyloceanibacter sp.]